MKDKPFSKSPSEVETRSVDLIDKINNLRDLRESNYLQARTSLNIGLP